MKSNYKRLGDYIEEIKNRDTKETVDLLLGVSIRKEFIPSIANIIGTDMSTYKIVERNQFAYGTVTSRNGEKISIALLEDFDKAIVSQAYLTFKINDETELLPEYLMMWFRRPEFDRYARFMSHGSAREIFSWEELCNTLMPIPDPNKQKEIVDEYNIIQNRIKLNETLIQKLEETAQAIYKSWFVDFEFPNEERKPYKSSGGEMVWCEELEKEIPKGWKMKKLSSLALLKYGKMLDSSLFKDKGYPVYSGYGVRGYFSEYMYKDPQILVLCRGVSGTGEVKLSPPYSYITNLSIVVEVIKDKVRQMYLFYFLKNANLRSIDSGSAQSQITTGDLYYQDVLLPLLDIQSSFEQIVLETSKNKFFYEQENKNLVELKSLILSKMSTKIINRKESIC